MSNMSRHGGTDSTTEKLPNKCDKDTQRLCMDGSCISRMELCQEEMMNQDTILIMVGVGMGVVLFLIMLYCIQQRRNSRSGEQEGVPIDDSDNPELLMPPPTYDEAVNVSLYPPTPTQIRRNERIPSLEEPTTPPPNYDAALHILAQSQENLCSTSAKKGAKDNPAMRRAVSVELLGISRTRPMTFSSFGANNRTFQSKKPRVDPSGASNA